jgi:hypothetical protein
MTVAALSKRQAHKESRKKQERREALTVAEASRLPAYQENNIKQAGR